MTSEDNKKVLNPKREALILLSNRAEKFRDEQIANAESEYQALIWASTNLNSIMLNHLYEVDGATEFHTFNQWKQKGATVIKGAKAFVIWGQPIHARPKEGKPEPGEVDTTDGYKYFPLCYLFSDKQVTFPIIKTTEAEQEHPYTETVNLDELM